MTVLSIAPHADLHNDVATLYDEFKDRISIGQLMMLPIDGGESKYYVYEWFTTDSQKVFYVGKGTDNRYKHIYADMARPRGEEYKELCSNFGISHRFAIKGITSYEAALYELCLIIKRTDEGEILIQSANNPAWYAYCEKRSAMISECNSRNFSPKIIVSPYEERYFGITPPKFDEVSLAGLALVSFHASFSRSSAKTVEEMSFLKKELCALGSKVFSTIAKSAKAVIEFDNIDYAKYAKFKTQGLFVYHESDVMRFCLRGHTPSDKFE